MQYLLNPETDPYYNMAFDEYVLDAYNTIDASIFYLWQNEPSVIIGANQNVHKEIDMEIARARGIKIVRRLTGGGAVYHDLGNVNFSFVGHASEEKNFVSLIANALRSVGYNIEVSGRNDILLCGRKISGMAKRVIGEKMLLHGTLMFDVDINTMESVLTPDNNKLKSKGIDSIKSRVANLNESARKMSLADFKMALFNQLAKTDNKSPLVIDKDKIINTAEKKYKNYDWIMNTAAIFTKTKEIKVPCGHIKMDMDVKDGKIKTIMFTGDYIGNKDVDGLISILNDTEYERGLIRAKLCNIRISDYFENLSNEDFIDILTN